MSDDLVLRIPGTNGYAVIPQHLVAQMEAYKQHGRRANESGGILLGSMRGEHIEINELTFPQIDDQQLRYRFNRKSNFHINKALETWKRSNKTEYYLGEWHTHPQTDASPSSYDYSSWRAKLPKRPLILIVIGRESHWYGYWNGLVLRKLIPMNVNDI